MTPRKQGINQPYQFSANFKIAEVAKRMGIQDLSKMQITTRQLYHALKIVPTAGLTSQTFNFFQDVNTVKFPLTNLTENKLQAGEAIAVERIYFSILQTYKDQPMGVIDVTPMEYHPAFRPFLRSDIDLNIDRQTVTKRINTTSFYAPFNSKANFGAYVTTSIPAGPPPVVYGQSIYHLDNSFIIIPQIEFSLTLTTPAIIATPSDATDFYLMCNIEGLGCLFNPKGNY
jgi:hypothetical protein